MWSRALRLLTAVFNIYSFYANPVKYIIGLLTVMLIPYLIYIFWGSIIVITLIALGFFGLYKLFTNKKNKTAY